MNLEELVKKVTSDTSEKPYITLEDIQGVVDEQKTTNETLSAITKERDELSLIEVKCSIGARDDLGRPTTTALENKQNFMEFLKQLQ